MLLSKPLSLRGWGWGGLYVPVPTSLDQFKEKFQPEIFDCRIAWDLAALIG